MRDAHPVYKSPAGHAAMMAWYDAALERLPVPYRCLTVPTRFGETHMIATGEALTGAPPVILIHGLGANALLWKPQLAVLSEHYRVYALDVIGQPGRSAPSRPPHNGPAYGHWLLDVLDGLEIGQAHVIGLSLGGRLTLKLGMLAPERVARAVLISPVGIKAQSAEFAARVVPLGLKLRYSPDESVRRLVQGVLAPPGLTADEELSEMMCLSLEHYRPDIPRDAALLFPLPRDELRRFRVPTLLLVGQHEKLFRPQAVVARARRVLPDLRAAEIVPGAGHAMNYDRPDFVNGRILCFLREGL